MKNPTAEKVLEKTFEHLAEMLDESGGGKEKEEHNVSRPSTQKKEDRQNYDNTISTVTSAENQ
ncbi:MAG: hypothetical protein V2I36_06915 [Desulfopila sp.]|jgi:hypothetical protein|nr:hypothetical protein [Desulfopila sp.]